MWPYEAEGCINREMSESSVLTNTDIFGPETGQYDSKMRYMAIWSGKVYHQADRCLKAMFLQTLTNLVLKLDKMCQMRSYILDEYDLFGEMEKPL